MKVTFTIADLKTDPRWVLDYARKEGAVNIACDGEIVAELRPVEPEKYTNKRRLEELRYRGELRGSGEPGRPFKPGKPAPGALARFLAEREAAYLECPTHT